MWNFCWGWYCHIHRYLGQTGRQEVDYYLTLAVVTLLGWFVLVCHVGNLKTISGLVFDV